MKNSVKVSMKVLMEISRLFDTWKFGKMIYQKVDSKFPVYQKFRYFLRRYDIIHRYRTDILNDMKPRSEDFKQL